MTKDVVVAIDDAGDVVSIILPEWSGGSLPDPEEFASRYPHTTGARGKLLIPEQPTPNHQNP